LSLVPRLSPSTAVCFDPATTFRLGSPATSASAATTVVPVGKRRGRRKSRCCQNRS